MDGIHRQLLADPAAGDVVGPFFGFMGAAAALVFACEFAQCSDLFANSVDELVSAPVVTCCFIC